MLVYNNKEFCSMILGRMKESGKYALDKLDYSLASDMELSNIVDGYFHFDTAYGGSEGIYTDIDLVYTVKTSAGVESFRKNVFTFKTLYEEWDNHEEMAIIGSGFVCRANQELRQLL